MLIVMEDKLKGRMKVDSLIPFQARIWGRIESNNVKLQEI